MARLECSNLAVYSGPSDEPLRTGLRGEFGCGLALT